MHLHHLVLKEIAAWLNREWQGAVLAECFTQEKDELVLGLGKPDEDLWIRIGCKPGSPYIWPLQQYHKARQNVLALFREIVGQTLSSAECLPWERCLILNFGAGALILKMHGLQSNVILLHTDPESGVPVPPVLFRQNLHADMLFEPRPGPFDAELLASTAAMPPADALTHLKRISPALDKNVAEKLQLIMTQGMNLPQAWTQALREAASDTWFIRRREQKLQFLPWSTVPDAELRVEGLLPALDRFLRNQMAYQNYAGRLLGTRERLQQQTRKTQGLIRSYEESIRQMEHERSHEETGSILMANLHALHTGMEEVELYDFYQDAPVRIKLRPELNPQQNAEHYFQKQKKLRARAQALKPLLETARAEADQYEQLLREAEAMPSPDTVTVGPDGLEPPGLNRMLSQWLEKNAVLLAHTEKQKQAERLPYHATVFMGFEIRVGGNNRDNEALTFHHSHKDDIWLHARNFAGAHVIICCGKRPIVPKPVLEHAAMLAARYSKGFRETVVPVQFTKRKFVRKIKGGTPGQVTLDKESVILVSMS